MLERSLLTGLTLEAHRRIREHRALLRTHGGATAGQERRRERRGDEREPPRGYCTPTSAGLGSIHRVLVQK
jgi:hypothetical protein